MTRGEVDLERYNSLDGQWRELGIPAPARRALVDAGVLTVEDLSAADFDRLATLHGMGPKALRILREALG